MTINNTLYEKACKVYENMSGVAECKVGNYKFFQIGQSYCLMYKGEQLFVVQHGEVTFEKAEPTKAQDKAIRTIKLVMDMI